MLVSLTVSVAPGLIKNPIPDRTQASYPELAHWFPLDFSLELAFVGWEPVQSDQVYLRSSLGLDLSFSKGNCTECQKAIALTPRKRSMLA